MIVMRLTDKWIVRLLIACLLAVGVSDVCEAAKKKKRTVKSARTEQQAAQRRIDETKRKINNNAASTQQKLKELNAIRGEMSLKEHEINLTRQSIDSLNRAIATTHDSITVLNAKLDTMRDIYVKALRRLQGTQYATDELGYIFSSESFAKAYARIRYIQEFSKWRKRKAAEIRAAMAEIELQKSRLAELQGVRTSTLNSLSTDQALLKSRQDEADRMVADLRRDGRNLQIALDKEKKRLQAINNDINRMIEEERRARDAERRKQDKTPPAKGGGKNGGKNGGGGGSASKPAPSQPKPKSRIDNSDPDAAMTQKFASAKGRMLFPVAGKYRIVSKYGSSDGSVNNTGIEIVLDGSTTCRSVFEGTVSRVFENNKSNGNYSVMVRHGAYITVFYNVSSPSVKAGQKVTAGQTIGQVGVDARYGKPMLHFEVRKGSQTFNPLSWVR